MRRRGARDPAAHRELDLGQVRALGLVGAEIREGHVRAACSQIGDGT